MHIFLCARLFLWNNFFFQVIATSLLSRNFSNQVEKEELLVNNPRRVYVPREPRWSSEAGKEIGEGELVENKIQRQVDYLMSYTLDSVIQK